MNEADIQRWADRILAAQDEGSFLPLPTSTVAALDVVTAYEIQDAVLERRLGRGEQLVGMKLGLTSRAKQQRMGIDSPLVAWLTDTMILAPGQPLPATAMQPRAEPEIAFLMAHRLEGPGVTLPHALAAVESVFGAIEVLDSRFEDYQFQLPDVIADNASTCGVAFGGVCMPPASLDLALEGSLLWVDGQPEDSATGAAVQGHPAAALAAATNELARRGMAVEAGWIVLTGGMTDAVAVSSGSWVKAAFSHLGSVAVARSSAST